MIYLQKLSKVINIFLQISLLTTSINILLLANLLMTSKLKRADVTPVYKKNESVTKKITDQ